MTSKQLLLHIGTGKTGSTSIQEALHQASVDGKLGEICYPQVERHNHNLLAALYKSEERLPRGYRNMYKQQGPDALASDACAFKEELFRSLLHSNKAIVSSEYLSGFAPSEIQALKSDLAQLGIAETLVVVYFRDPASHYLSNVQQSLKAARTYAAPAVYRHPVGQVLRNWGEEFPNLVVRPFVKRLLVGGDPVRDFLRVASSFFGLDDNLDLPTTVVNQSVSAEGMIVLQRYRSLFYPNADDHFKRDSTDLHRVLQQSMSAISQTRPKLAPSVEQVIAGNHQHDLEMLWREYGVDLRVEPRGQTNGDPGTESYEGPRRWNDVTQILESYDEDILDELLYYCVKEAFRAHIDRYNRQISKRERRISRQNKRIEDLEGELAEVLASRFWRWGHRLALLLSSPRRLIRAIRRNRPN